MISHKGLHSLAPQLAVVIDFDGTITTKDTIDTLFNFALARQRKIGGNDYTETWRNIIAKYSEDYGAHVQSYRPELKDRTGLREEILFQRSLGGVELRSFNRVSESGIFKGITHSEWEDAGRDAVRRKEDVIIRPGFIELVEQMKNSDAKWGILSVNFSASFIRGVMCAALGEEGGSQTQIISNISEEDGYVRGPKLDTGESHDSLMTTSGDKLAVMKKLLARWGVPAASSQNLSKIIYFGDSGTDIECLTEDGVTGVALSEDGNSKLLKTTERIGVRAHHIQTYNGGKGTHGEIWWAKDFHEVLRSSLFQKSNRD